MPKLEANRWGWTRGRGDTLDGERVWIPHDYNGFSFSSRTKDGVIRTWTKDGACPSHYWYAPEYDIVSLEPLPPTEPAADVEVLSSTSAIEGNAAGSWCEPVVTEKHIKAWRQALDAYNQLAPAPAYVPGEAEKVLARHFPVGEVERLREENERLKRGDFTPEEFQNLCHNGQSVKCWKHDFFDGCADYQQNLFGTSEREEANTRIAELEKTLGVYRTSMDRAQDVYGRLMDAYRKGESNEEVVRLTRLVVTGYWESAETRKPTYRELLESSADKDAELAKLRELIAKLRECLESPTVERHGSLLHFLEYDGGRWKEDHARRIRAVLAELDAMEAPCKP